MTRIARLEQSTKCLAVAITVSTCQLFAQHEGIQANRVSTSAASATTISRTPITLNRASSTGQWVSFKNWNEGRAVVAENDSIVWVGTSVGLVRWNVATRTYQTFDETNGLPYTSINGLAIDRLGQLWIATTKGVIKYAGGVFSVYNFQNSNLPNTAFSHLAVDSTNRIYATYEWYIANNVLYDGGVAVFDGTYWSYINIYNTIGTFGPSAICVYHDTVWIGAYDNFYILDGGTVIQTPNWIGRGVSSLAVDYQNNLWVETGRKTFKRSGNSWQVIIDRDAEQMGSLFDNIWNDPRGGLWLSMHDVWWASWGPYRLDINLRQQGILCGTQYPGICTISGIPGHFFAHSAFSDTSQFFVYNWGLFKFNGTRWTTFVIPRTLFSNEIYLLGCSPSGEVYISSPLAFQKTNGLQWDSVGGPGWINPPIRFHPNGTVWLGGIPTSPPRYVTGLDFDGYGAYWGAYGSVMTLGGSFGFREWRPSDIGITSSAQFMDIAVDKHERIWADGWYFPAAMFDRTNWHLFPCSYNTLPNCDYDRIFADSKDRIWFSSHSSPNYGFTMYDGIRWRTFYSPQRYSISYVYQFAEDNFGNVWLATGGALLKYDGSSFTIFDSDNSPMNTNYVSAVTVDLRGNIWVGTNSGLHVYNPAGAVELGPYSFTSPVDSLTVVTEGRFAKAKFRTLPNPSVPIRYQLQRGRGTHKFWAVNEIQYSNNVPPTVEIWDSSAIIGRYYYRIREVASDGRIRLSPSVQVVGSTPSVTLLRFEYHVLGKQVFLRWQTKNEQFTQRFEVWRRDSTGGQFTFLRSVFPDSTNNEIKLYEILADSLRRSAQQSRYSLQIVYVDSTRSEIGTLDVTPQLPQAFKVSQNYPNPFNNSTTFDIEMPVSGLVTLKLYDILGREIPIHVAQQFDEGYRQLQLSMPAMASGVYVYTIESLGWRTTGKLVLLK